MLKMTSKHKHELAGWTSVVPESEIRRLLKYKGKVKYYFGGGLPGALAEDVLAKIVKDIGNEMLERVPDGARALQLFNYGMTAGDVKLRKVLMRNMVNRQHLPFDPEGDYDKIMLTAGSQQSLYGILDTVTNPGDYIIASAPSYLGFVSPAVKLGNKVVLAETDTQGISIDSVQEAISAIKKASGKPPKILYTIPDSHNPKGTTLPEDRRKALFEIGQDEGILIVEDAAYKEIQFTDRRVDPIKKLDTENDVVAYLGTSSKEAGVFRLGYTVFPDFLRNDVEKAKGFYDLCNPVFMQELAYRYYSMDLDKILKDSLAVYQERAKAMVQGINDHFPEGIFTEPTGGFFVWWETEEGVEWNCEEFNTKVAIPNNALFCPSHAFYPPVGYEAKGDSLVEVGPKYNAMRLSFSAVPASDVSVGMEIIGRHLKGFLR